MRRAIHSAMIQNRSGERAQFTGRAVGFEPMFSYDERVLFETDNSYTTKVEGEEVRLHKVRSLDEGAERVLYFTDVFVTRSDY